MDPLKRKSPEKFYGCIRISYLRFTFEWIHNSKVLFALLLYLPVNRYSHVETVSSPNHTFFLGKLEQVFNQYFVHILSLVTDNPSWMN